MSGTRPPCGVDHLDVYVRQTRESIRRALVGARNRMEQRDGLAREDIERVIAIALRETACDAE